MTQPQSGLNYALHERNIPAGMGMRKLLTVASIILVLLTAVEMTARQRGDQVNFPFTSDMWVGQWYRLDSLPDNQTVFIGASRVQFGLIVNEWERQTGVRPLLLAWPGSPPGLILQELAKRQSFKGTVICGIAPPFSFVSPRFPVHDWTQRNLAEAAVLKTSLAFHLSYQAQYFLKPRFRCLNDAAFSPIAMLYERWPIPNREGLLTPLIFPFGATRDGDMQMRFTDEMETNKKKQEFIARIQKASHLRLAHYGPANTDSLIRQYTEDVSTIEKRGGKVIFLRPPSDGHFRAFEKEHYPREQYFDRLVKASGCYGIHFEDHAELRDFRCVETSHLSKRDGIEFTKRVVEILQRDQIID
tara:strand:- start:67 stop:1140 length:1074 start_codon:yes stop_codon:yes gene_type:complete